MILAPAEFIRYRIFNMSAPENILKVENLSKTYISGGRELTVLREVSFEVNRGAAESIVGPSGSGKTTLLGLCAGSAGGLVGAVDKVPTPLEA